jgi:hypothetical protein
MPTPFEINPTFCFTLLGSFVIYLWTRPPRAAWIGVLALACALRLACIRATGGLGTYFGVWWISWGAFLGIASLLILSAQIVFSDRPERKYLRLTFYAASVFPLCSMLIGYALPLTIRLRPRTFDAFLLTFDGSLGFQPSFSLGRFLVHHPALWDLTTVVYYAMPLGAAVLYGAYRVRARQPVAVLALFLTLMAAGLLEYVIFPAVGPGYAFHGLYPFRLPDLAGLMTGAAGIGPAVGMLTIPVGARNCMPSLHLAGALIVWWNSRIWPRWGRALAFAFLVGTAVSTLGLGEHYVADLVAAFPFALIVQAAWTRVPDSARQMRRIALGTGCGLTLTWLVLLRYGLPVFLISPFISWALIVLTVGMCEAMVETLGAVIL